MYRIYDGEKTSDTMISKLYDLGSDVVLSIDTTNVVLSFLDAFYRRHVFFQHQDPVRHRSTMIFRGELVIEPKWRVVTVRGKEAKLTRNEFELLNYLACNADIVLLRKLIADRVWGSDEIINSSINSAIARLRRRIEPDAKHPTYIQTVYGVGYRFKS